MLGAPPLAEGSPGSVRPAQLPAGLSGPRATVSLLVLPPRARLCFEGETLSLETGRAMSWESRLLSPIVSRRPVWESGEPAAFLFNSCAVTGISTRQPGSRLRVPNRSVQCMYRGGIIGYVYRQPQSWLAAQLQNRVPSQKLLPKRRQDVVADRSVRKHDHVRAVTLSHGDVAPGVPRDPFRGVVGLQLAVHTIGTINPEFSGRNSWC